MGNELLLDWWRAAMGPAQWAADWHEAFAKTWAEVYSPSGSRLIGGGGR